MADTDPIAELTQRSRPLLELCPHLAVPLLVVGTRCRRPARAAANLAARRRRLRSRRAARMARRGARLPRHAAARWSRITWPAPRHYAQLRQQPNAACRTISKDRDGPKSRRFSPSATSEIYEQLKTFGVPPTKRYPGQLPLFPIIYRLQVRFDLQGSPLADWRPYPSAATAFASMRRSPGIPACPPTPASIRISNTIASLRDHLCPLSAARLQQTAAHRAGPHQRLRQVSALAVGGTVLGLTWMVIVQRRERERERQRLQRGKRSIETERLLLQEEQRHAETERQLLEQRLATQAAERQALELKSQMWASIGIMAGSYAHNIKNLLVRPNDLLRRCLEAAGLSSGQADDAPRGPANAGHRDGAFAADPATVRRDPSQAEPTGPRSQRRGRANWSTPGRTWPARSGSWSWSLELSAERAAVDQRRRLALAAGHRKPAVQRPRCHF